MYKRLVLVSTLALLLVPVAALADSMIDFSVTSPAPGSISYAGGATDPLVGSSIGVSLVTGLPSGTSFNVLNGVLNFQSGAFSSSNASTWTFDGAGSSL